MARECNVCGGSGVISGGSMLHGEYWEDPCYACSAPGVTPEPPLDEAAIRADERAKVLAEVEREYRAGRLIWRGSITDFITDIRGFGDTLAGARP